ncbi:type IV pilus assembly protein PilM [bacterium]|nr:type IV pilus assembly protein PilM [bacterium]
MFGGGKKVVGLDVGSSSVKAVEVRRTGTKLELVRFGIADVYPGGDRSAAGNADIYQLKTAAIRRALQSGKITAKHSVSAVSGESIIVRYIQLPNMPEADLKNALRWEAEEYIPFSIDEVNLDSVVLGNSTVEGKVDVLLVSARKDLVAEHVQLVRSAELTPIVVDVEGFAFLNCFEVNYQPARQDCICLVNMGADVTNINIYVGNTSRFSRDISVAGNQVTQSIMQKCGVPWMEAERLKRTVGLAPPEREEDTEAGENELISTIRGTVQRITGSDLGDDSPESTASKAIQNVINQLVSEVRRSIQFFEGQSGGTTVQRVVIGGGSSSLKNIAPFLGGELDISCELFDPLRSISVSRDVDSALIDAHRAQLGASIGLALRKVLD